MRLITHIASDLSVTATTVRRVPIGCDNSDVCSFRVSCPSGYRGHEYDHSGYNPFLDWVNYAIYIPLGAAFVAAHATLPYFLQNITNLPRADYLTCCWVVAVIDATYCAMRYCSSHVVLAGIRIGLYALFYVLFVAVCFVIGMAFVSKKTYDNALSPANTEY